MKRANGSVLVFSISLWACLYPSQAQQVTGSTTNSIGMKMVRVSAGTFFMGNNDKRDLWNERPVHEVCITRPFLISETEVTVEQFRKFRSGFEGTAAHRPYAAGVSWNEARIFADWLSRREGKFYRLPTEAEWEYVARSGTEDSNSQARGRMDRPNAWGVKNMLAGPLEWCLDWFAEYSPESRSDPIGPAEGLVKIVRGGTLDLEERNRGEVDFGRPAVRLAMPPSFGPHDKPQIEMSGTEESRAGLIGVWYQSLDFQNPQEVDQLSRLNNSWSNDPRAGGRWSAHWRGYLEAPCAGPMTITLEAEGPVSLEWEGKRLLDSRSTPPVLSAVVEVAHGRKYPILLAFARSAGSSFRFYWQWSGQPRELIPNWVISHTTEEEKTARAEAKAEKRPGYHAIGFRLVQADMPASKPLFVEIPFVRQGVKQSTENVLASADPRKPYFRKRHLLPTPPENSPNEAIDALGMHPSFRRHNHSPGLEIFPNGDVFLVIYTSYAEYEPGVSLIAARLRFGAEEWDMPSRFLDCVGVNDHAPLAWKDDGIVRVFWGNPKLAEGGYPFQWTSSTDNGATWEPIRFPNFTGRIGSHTPQPINTAFKDGRGKWYLSSDGSGGESVLWESPDGGQTWRDPGGRSAGRHTGFVLLKGGGILGMGGKNTHIDEYMPKAVSRDGGRTYEVSKTPFTRQGSNQRPTLLRLQSGRLLFAGDFIYLNDGSQPKGVDRLGCYVALSEDEGETWSIRPLMGAQLHEDIQRAERMRSATLGYAVARQAPNGMIHLIGTMTNPCLHFEFNEAWILDKPQGQRSDAEWMVSGAKSIVEKKTMQEQYADGKQKIVYSGGIADDGRFLLDGTEIWYYPNGRKQREAGYTLGRKVGVESYWSEEGKLLWSREYREDGTSLWRQWWPEGRLKSESAWMGFKAHGPAKLWDPAGKLIGEKKFADGKIVP